MENKLTQCTFFLWCKNNLKYKPFDGIGLSRLTNLSRLLLIRTGVTFRGGKIAHEVQYLSHDILRQRKGIVYISLNYIDTEVDKYSLSFLNELGPVFICHTLRLGVKL